MHEEAGAGAGYRTRISVASGLHHFYSKFQDICTILVT
jgi:hypothetical protein